MSDNLPGEKRRRVDSNIERNMSDYRSKRKWIRVDGRIKITKDIFFSMPLTCVQIIRIIKYYYNEELYVPFVSDPTTTEVINEIQKQFHRNETHTLRLDKAIEIHALFNRSLVQHIKPWLYSTSWIMMYFIHKKQKEDIIKDLYNHLITKGYNENLFTKTITNAILQYIFDLPSQDPTRDKLISLSEKAANHIKNQLNGKRCQSEIKILLKNPFKFELYSVTSDDEKNIKLAFALLTNGSVPQSLPYTLMAYPPFILYNDPRNENFYKNELNLSLNIPKNGGDFKRVHYFGYVAARDNPNSLQEMMSSYQQKTTICGLENHSNLILVKNSACEIKPDLRSLICNIYFERDVETGKNSIPGTND